MPPTPLHIPRMQEHDGGGSVCLLTPPMPLHIPRIKSEMEVEWSRLLLTVLTRRSLVSVTFSLLISENNPLMSPFSRSYVEDGVFNVKVTAGPILKVKILITASSIMSSRSSSIRKRRTYLPLNVPFTVSTPLSNVPSKPNLQPTKHPSKSTLSSPILTFTLLLEELCRDLLHPRTRR